VTFFILCIFTVVCLVTCIYKHFTSFRHQICLVTCIYKHINGFRRQICLVMCIYKYITAASTFAAQLKFNLFQMTLDGKPTKIKVVGLKRLWNFIVDNVLIKNHLVIEKYVWSFQIQKSNLVNDLGRWNYQNKSFRSQKVMQLCSWQGFHLNSFSISNNQFTLDYYNIWERKRNIDTNELVV
jgi:heme/copper-type cytochrome/quinol oxidase subunit 2